MKRFLGLASVACLIALSAGARAADILTPLALALEVDRTETLPGEPLRAVVNLKNVSSQNLSVGNYWNSLGIYIAAGKAEYGPPLPSADIGRTMGGRRDLAAGTSAGRGVILFCDFDSGKETVYFPNPGTYRVKVTLNVDVPTRATLESPEIQIIVKDLPAEEVEPHRLITTSVAARRALRSGGSSQDDVLQQVVGKFPGSVYADPSRICVALGMFSRLPRLNEVTGELPPRSRENQQAIKKAYDIYGQVTDRQPSLKFTALDYQARIVNQIPELITRADLTTLIEQYRKHDAVAAKFGASESYESQLKALASQIEKTPRP